MFICLRNAYRNTVSAAIILHWAVAGLASSVHAQETPGSDKRRPIIGCGKAQAAARLLRARRADPIDRAYLETMANTDVLHYALDIEITDINTASETCTITGTNTMTVKSITESLTEFTFRLADYYTINDPFIGDSTPVTVTTVSTTTRVVTLDQTYGMDQIFTLTIPYTGVAAYVPGSIGGSIMINDVFGNPEVSTLSEPFFAYSWWPAKDGDVLVPGDNSDKATVEFSITVPDNLTVASNGLLQSVETLSGDRKRYNWASDYPITTYLVSFAASVYDTWTVDYAHPGGTMPVEFYVYPSWNTSSNRAQWEKCLNMLGTFRHLFGEYPFIDEKYGIYNFDFGGGMEHQTMTGQSSFSEWLTAHELAHQWWGDMITCKTWNHIWLNEGFASYAEALWAENKPGSSGLPALKAEMAGMRYLGGGSVYVTDEEIADEDYSIWNIFSGATSYNKGAWVLHMLRHVLGDDNFYDALAAYRTTYEFSAATTEDFQAVCEQFYDGASLDWFFQEWVYGEYVPDYAWGWDAVEINGQDYLLVYIDQVQSASYQRFTMPIDVVVDGTAYVVFNDNDPEHFVVPVSAAPTTVALDPDAWILWGSVTETTHVPGPPTIVETSPAPGEAVAIEDAVNTVTVTFHTNVDVQQSHFSLVGARTGSKSFTIASTGGVNPVTLNLFSPLAIDTYTLTVTDGVTGSATGLALDGEVGNPVDLASLPSGDGVAGGDAVIEFAVLGPVPAASEWGLLILALLLVSGATVVLRYRPRPVLDQRISA